MKSCPLCQIRYPTNAVYCFVDGAELVATRDPFIGTTLAGQYVIEDQIGEGGMASVYRARYKLVDRPCAVKMMKPALAAEAKVRERFRREAKSAQALTHPNVIEIFDHGETDGGTPYIVMELLEGQTLSALIDEGPVPTLRALPLMIQIARGIARAHDLGVVHRDLKPDNIFICERADRGDLVKILDFGIARSRTDSRLTSAGELFGTPQYMAPERIMSGDAGPSVDLYAAGVIFFEMVTAGLPFEASDPPTFLVKHLKEPAPAPRTRNPRVHERLDALILELLQKDPSARPVDAHRVEQDLVALARVLGAAVPPDPETDPESSTRPPASARPGIVVEQWKRRVVVFELMAARAYGPRPPAEQEQWLAEIRLLVRQIDEVRKASAKEQRILETIEARGREGRQRLGFAVDALGLDASKAKEDARAARARTDALARKVGEAARLYDEAHDELLSWEGRSAQTEPYPQLAEAHRTCAAAMDGWLAAKNQAREATEAVDAKDRTVDDLDYQIAQLRSALASHEQGIDRDRDAARRRAVELDALADQTEGRLLQLASAFCAPLRTRPDLGLLFQSLEASTA
ncbi:MAG: serine/threonine-protein kinase [Polyangiaceae bacterium]|jgi:serine/threonine-protein kinase